MSPNQLRARAFRPVVMFVGMAAVWCAAQAVHAAPYTFEGLSNGTLNGQDNWADFITAGNNHVVATVSPSHVGTTKVVTGFDQTARINNGSYSFLPHLANDTAALIEFDVKSDSGDTAVFALGRALAPLGHQRLGPQFGVYGGLNAFMIRGASEGAITTSAMTGGDSVSDWYRLRLVIDFTANSGNGAGSLYVRNLTDGDLDFRVTPVLAGINLQIVTQMETASENPATWDSMYIRSATTTTQFDNLNANAMVVPEPSTALLMGMGLAGLVIVRRRRGGRN